MAGVGEAPDPGEFTALARRSQFGRTERATIQNARLASSTCVADSLITTARPVSNPDAFLDRDEIDSADAFALLRLTGPEDGDEARIEAAWDAIADLAIRAAEAEERRS